MFGFRTREETLGAVNKTNWSEVENMVSVYVLVYLGRH